MRTLFLQAGGFTMDPMSIMAICGIAGTFWVLWAMTKNAKKENMEIGEYLDKFFIKNFDLLLLGFLIWSYLAESLIASALHPKDSFILLPYARFMNHIGISFFGFIAAIFSTKALMAVFESFQFLVPLKNSKGVVIRESSFLMPALMFFVALITLYISFWTPYANCAIIAKGFGQSKEIDYAFDLISQWLHPWSMSSKIQLATRYGMDPNKTISEILEFNVNNSFFLTQGHIAASLLKGLTAAINTYILGIPGYAEKIDLQLRKRAARKSLGEKYDDKAAASSGAKADDKKADEKKPDEKKDATKLVIETCLKVFNLTDAQRADYVNKIIDGFSKISSAQVSSQIAGSFNHYAVEADLILETTKSMSPADRKEAIKNFSFLVTDLIKAKPDAGLGLDLELIPLE